MLVGANCTAATYTAFCRKHGHHSTSTVGSRDWNGEVIERMVGDLAAPWQRLRSMLQNQHKGIVDMVRDQMDWGIQFLGEL
jgi:hypothetical protein